MSLGLSLGLCVAPKVSLGLAGRALVEGGGWLMLEAGPQRADTPPGHSPAASLLTLQVPWGERRGGVRVGWDTTVSLSFPGDCQVLQPGTDWSPAGDAVETPPGSPESGVAPRPSGLTDRLAYGLLRRAVLSEMPFGVAHSQ